MIGQNVDLPELNLLALRLTMLSEDDRMGLDCLLQIEKENHTTPFPLSRLINLTFNADICLLAPQVSDPKELGALLYEGEMLSDEAMALVDTMDEDSDFRERLLELLGEQHQEEHGGVFTSRSYAEPGGDFKEVYATIASSLGLTKNQVSAFCRRNQLTGTKAAVHIEDRPDPNCCRNCGKPLTQTPGRKPVKFCSDACRTKWWNSHLDKVNRKAFYTFTCAHCGKPFTAYGNDHRKYCSHECYIADRFGGDRHD